jgi:hypothetical protein
MDVTKPCEFIRFAAMDLTKPHDLLGFGAMRGPAKATAALTRARPPEKPNFVMKLYFERFLLEDLPDGIGCPVGASRQLQEAPTPDAEIDDNFVKVKPKRPNIHNSFIQVHPMLHNSASGPEIGLPGQISAEF